MTRGIKKIWLWIVAIIIKSLALATIASAWVANRLLNHYLDSCPGPGLTIQVSARNVFVVSNQTTLLAYPNVGSILFKRL